MSHTESPSTTLKASEESSAEVSVPDPDERKPSVNIDGSAQDSRLKERILKEVGVTSTAFIGPAFPPPKNTAKSLIEDSLGEFYKEIGNCDTPDGANGNTDKGVSSVPEKDTGPEVKIVNPTNFVETDSFQKTSGRKQPWPHWHQNEPYNPRRQKPDINSGRTLSHQWDYPESLNKPPASSRPPVPHQPDPAFSNQQNSPARLSPSLNQSNINQGRTEEFSSFLHHNAPSQSSQEYDGNIQRHDSKCVSDNTPATWYPQKEESHLNKYYNQPHRFDSDEDIWERDHQYESCGDAPSEPSEPVLILMRGLPGSGKSTRARELLSTGHNGVILSTDDYFAYKNNYRYEASLIGAAHDWNQHRAREALYDGHSPVIIDNTNLQAWEMKPYVKMALGKGYKVEFSEPETSWKFDPYELERRNKHGVPQEKIAQMLERFSFPISVEIVMNSQEPPHVTQRGRREETSNMKNKQDFH